MDETTKYETGSEPQIKITKEFKALQRAVQMHLLTKEFDALKKKLEENSKKLKESYKNDKLTRALVGEQRELIEKRDKVF